MARKMRVQLAFITNAAKRKAACKKRKTGLIKKMNELATLCGVDVCAIVNCSELNPQLEFWPNKLEAERVIEEFRSLPQGEQTKYMYDLKRVTRKSIAKANKKLQKLLKANREMELTNVMSDCLAGRSGLPDRGLEDMDALGRIVDRKLDDIEKRIGELLLNDPSQVGASTSSAADMAAGGARD